MKFYLAARYSRRQEMRALALILAHEGHLVTSRWINGSHEMDGQTNDLVLSRYAIEDLADVNCADALVLFTEFPEAEGRKRGGRFVEFGYAAGRNKMIVIVGPTENVFCHLPGVLRFDHVDLFVLWARENRNEIPAMAAVLTDSEAAAVEMVGQ